jgi:hypothetical protein
MFNIGAMSINEIREKEDMDPVEGGDIHLIPLNMTSLEDAGKEPTQTQRPLLPILPKKKKEEVLTMKEGQKEGESGETTDTKSGKAKTTKKKVEEGETIPTAVIVK